LLFSAGTLLNRVLLLKVLSLGFTKVNGIATCLNWEALVLCANGPSYSPLSVVEGTGAEAETTLKGAWPQREAERCWQWAAVGVRWLPYFRRN